MNSLVLLAADIATQRHFNALVEASAGARPFAYLSTPITGGQVYLDKLRVHGFEAMPRFAEYVVSTNTERAGCWAVQAEATLGPSWSIVNPACVTVSGWTQTQYLDHWISFITSEVDRLLVAPDWPLSAGAVAEVSAWANLGRVAEELGFGPLDELKIMRRCAAAARLLRTSGDESQARKIELAGDPKGAK